MHPEDPLNPGEIDLNNPQNFNSAEEVAWVRNTFTNDANNFMRNLVCPVYKPPAPDDCEGCNGFNPPPCACLTTDFLTDTKVRFELAEEDIYHHADTPGYLNNGAGCSSSQAGLSNLNKYGDPCKLNIFLLGEITSGFGGCGLAYSGEHANFLWYKGLYEEYTEDNGIAWSVSKVHVHEVGHCLGMLHSAGRETQFPDMTGSANDLINTANVPTCPTGGPIPDPVTNQFPFPNRGTNNTMSGSWRSNLGSITPLQIGQMHRMLLSGWRSKWLNHAYDASRTVTIPSGANETWDTAKLIHGDIIVKSGARLSIQCKVIMPAGGRIIVEKGARLSVNGGLITVAAAECGEYWQGIQVHGNPDLPQAMGSTEHGSVVLSNDAIIEFARTAVMLDSDDSGLTGGILWCLGATFRNNNRAIAFHKYDHGNISFVTGVTFTIDDEYSASSLAPQVTMWEVNRINFSSCEFIDEQTVTSNSYIPMRGIYSLGSGFNVSNSDFTNQQLGILGEDSGTVNSYNISGNNFSNCGRAIQSSAVNNISITENMITGVGEYPQAYLYDGSPNHEGIYIFTGTGFDISENVIIGNFSSNQGSVGICVRQAGGETNSVSNNSVEHLTVGIEALGQNNNFGSSIIGLEFECNYQDDISTDFFITPPGVSTAQGDIDEPAHNQFDYPVSSSGFNSSEHIRNLGEPLTYFFYKELGTMGTNIFEPRGTEISGTTTIEVNILKECAEDTGGGIDIGGSNPDLAINQLEQSLNDKKFQYQQKTTQLANLIDEGDTDDIVNEVKFASTSDTPELFDKLRSISPYVSKETLEEVSKQDNFSNPLKVEILTASPDEIRSDEFKYDIALENNFSSFEQTALDAVEQSISSRTLLNLEIKQHAAEVHRIANTVIDFYLQQETIDYNKLRTWYAHKGSLEAQMKIVDTWLAEGNAAAAQSALNSIQIESNSSAAQSEELSDFNTLKNMQIGLINDNRTVAELQGSEISQLESIANNSEGIASAQSQSILNFFYDYNYYPLSELPSDYSNGRLIAQKEALENKTDTYLVIQPNPVKDWTAIQYELPENSTEGFIRIQNVTGQIVFKRKITNSQGIINWLVNDLSKGVYIATLTVENQVYQSNKIIVTKR